MFDRYDPRDDDSRDGSGSWDRNIGSRGGSSDRDRKDERDPRDVFTKDLDLPRGRERRPVRERDRVYEIDGAEGRMLGTIGAFRVVAESRDTIYTACERKELRHVRVGGRRSIRLKPEWIDAWLERHARGAQEQQHAGHAGSMLGGA